MKVRSIIPVMLLSLSATAQQQAPKDTVIKGATIEIIQSYKPEVTSAPWPEPSPTLPPVDTSTPRLRYNVPEQTLFYAYSSLPLRPLALDISEPESLYDGYVKLGGGNLSTLYLDAGTGRFKGDNYNTALHVSHLSQSGAIRDQKVSATNFDATGSLNTVNHTLGAKVGIGNSRYHYYGYDHSLYNYNISNIRQSFTNIDLAVDMASMADSGKKISYHPSIKFYSFSESFGSTAENSVQLSVPVTYVIDSFLQIYATVNATYTGYRGQTNNIFSIAPGIRFSRDIFTGHAAIAPTWGRNGDMYFLPDIEVAFTLPGTQFMFNAGWNGSLIQNSYRQLATGNPFIFNTYNILQTPANELFAGIKSNIGNHISFNGRVSWWQYKDMPVFINDTTGDGKNFMVIHDSKVNAIGLQAGIRYQVAHTFSIGFNGQWMNFYNKTFPQLWHVPGVRFTGDFSLQPIKKLTVNGYVSFMDEIYALEKGNNTVKLNSILDIGAGAEYEVLDRLSLFIQANNILNSSNQRWNGYDALGFNIFGGARFKF